jgi:hypothetical protein
MWWPLYVQQPSRLTRKRPPGMTGHRTSAINTSTEPTEGGSVCRERDPVVAAQYAWKRPRCSRTGTCWHVGRGTWGGHHENMRGPYSEIGCGVFVNGNEVTVVQAFR